MSSSLHDISHVLLASAYPQVVTVYNIASLTGWRSRDLLISFWYLTHHFAAKNPKKKTGWLITLKNGKKMENAWMLYPPYSVRWFWKNLFSPVSKEEEGDDTRRIQAGYHTNSHNTLLILLLYEIPTWCEDWYNSRIIEMAWCLV